MDKSKIEDIRQQSCGPISSAEAEFLEDVKGFIEFAVRNGLSFMSVMSSLAHDINGLYRYGLDLKEAEKDGFTPKVGGYAEITEDSVGEVEEPIETD